MRTNTVGMRQGQEHVIVGLAARTPAIELRVDFAYRTKQMQRLINEMTTQIIKKAAGLLDSTALAPTAFQLRPPSFQTRLKTQHATQCPCVDQSTEGEALAVPAPRVVCRNLQLPGACRLDNLPRLRGSPRKRLIDNNR